MHLHTPIRPIKINALGRAIDARIATVYDFSVAGVNVGELEFLVGGGQAPLGSAGELGQNLLGLADVEYDLSHGNVRLMRVHDCHTDMLSYWVKAGQSYSLVDLHREPGLSTASVVTATLNGVNIKAMLSTGNSQSLVSPQAAERAGVKLDSPRGGRGQ